MIFMPGWKVHLVIGLALFSFLAILLDFSMREVVILLPLSILFSLFPDIDLKKSKARKIFSSISVILFTIVYLKSFPETWYYSLGYVPILYIILNYIPSKHRKLTHSTIFSLIFSLAISYVVYTLTSVELLKAFAVIFSSYLGHLLADL